MNKNYLFAWGARQLGGRGESARATSRPAAAPAPPSTLACPGDDRETILKLHRLNSLENDPAYFWKFCTIYRRFLDRWTVFRRVQQCQFDIRPKVMILLSRIKNIFFIKIKQLQVFNMTPYFVLGIKKSRSTVKDFQSGQFPWCTVWFYQC